MHGPEVSAMLRRNGIGGTRRAARVAGTAIALVLASIVGAMLGTFAAAIRS